jgi:hypothetical protein
MPWQSAGYSNMYALREHQLLVSCLAPCRKVVLSLSWLDSDWFTSQMVAPLASHWANTMAWLAGSSGTTCSAEVGCDPEICRRELLRCACVARVLTAA